MCKKDSVEKKNEKDIRPFPVSSILKKVLEKEAGKKPS